jgi:hypothetical protein
LQQRLELRQRIFSFSSGVRLSRPCTHVTGDGVSVDVDGPHESSTCIATARAGRIVVRAITEAYNGTCRQ